MNYREFQKLSQPMWRRIFAMTGRGVIENVDDSTKVQSLQVTILGGDVADDVERFQEFGFSSRPLPGAEHIYLALSGGNEGHLVVVATDDERYRPTDLEPGDTCLYTDQDAGEAGPHRIILTRNGVIKLLTGEHTQVILDRDEVNIHQGQTRVRIADDGIDLYTPRFDVWDPE